MTSLFREAELRGISMLSKRKSNHKPASIFLSFLCAIGRCITRILGVGVLAIIIIVRFVVAVVPGVFALIFVVVVIIGRTQIDCIQQDAGDLRIDLREDIAGAAECLLVGISGTDEQPDGT